MTIRTGIGGWTYEGWRGGTFYPPGLAQKDELSYATRAVGAIEINATFYRLQKSASFAAWRDTAPAGFVFSVKGSRFVTNRKELAGAGDALDRFFGQGLDQLQEKLGPIVWQLAKTKRFESEDLRAFVAILPRELEGRPLRHAIEIGHESFACAEFVSLAREAGVAIVWSEEEGRVAITDRTADFAYLRLQRLRSNFKTGYPPAEIERIAALCRAWSNGEAPKGLPYAGQPAESRGTGGDVFAFMINGAKERAPAAAQALAQLTGELG